MTFRFGVAKTDFYLWLICGDRSFSPKAGRPFLASSFGCGGRIWTYDLQVMSLIM